MSKEGCRTYLFCSDCVAHKCVWVVHSEKLARCFSDYHEAPFSLSNFVESGATCPPEPIMYYVTKSGFPIWGPVLIAILLLLGFRFVGRRFFRTLNAHFLTRSGSLEISEDAKNKHSGTAKSPPNQQFREESDFASSNFFQRAAPSNGLEKVATLNWQLDSTPKGTLNLEFDEERMAAYLTDGTVKQWDWEDSKETTIRFGIKLTDVVTSFQYDEEIIILGTAAGTVHLYDASLFEERWSFRFEDPVGSVKFLESTLIILTRGFGVTKFWWVEISRSDMKMLNRRLVLVLPNLKSFLPKCMRWLFRFTTDSSSESVGFLLDSEYSYLYAHSAVGVRYANSGAQIINERGLACWLLAPAGVMTLRVASLISANRILIAGCKNGTIAMWNTGKLTSPAQLPFKQLKGHTKGVRSLCALNGHLLSVDEGGKLFMWSGFDLECEDIDAPVPRILAQNFLNVSCLAGHERWFASGSSEKGIINIWALPDLWLRTG